MGRHKEAVELRNCKQCGKIIRRKKDESPSKYNQRIYCTKKCKAIASRKASICTLEGCRGKVAGRGLCWKHYRRWLRHGDPLYKAPKKVYSTQPCLQCGNDIPIKKMPPQKFCNTKCYAAYRKANAPAAPKLFCEYCGKLIPRKKFPSGRLCQMVIFAKKKYCNRKCSGAAKKGKSRKATV